MRNPSLEMIIMYLTDVIARANCNTWIFNQSESSNLFSLSNPAYSRRCESRSLSAARVAFEKRDDGMTRSNVLQREKEYTVD